MESFEMLDPLQNHHDKNFKHHQLIVIQRAPSGARRLLFFLIKLVHQRQQLEQGMILRNHGAPPGKIFINIISYSQRLGVIIYAQPSINY